MLFCLAVQRSSHWKSCIVDPISVKIDDVIGNQLIGHVENSEIARLYFYMGNVDSEDISQVAEQAVFLFDTIQNTQFRINIDLQEYLKTKAVYVVAQDLLSMERTILKYSINPDFYRCNENALEITTIKDFSDSCAEITILYRGIGDVFVMGATANEGGPETKTIISDGLYLGKWAAFTKLGYIYRQRNREVSTVICGIYTSSLYTFYTTVID